MCGDHYAGVPTRTLGMVSVHDHKRESRALVLCEGSMAHVPLADAVAWQDELPQSADQPVQPTGDALTLF